MRARAQGQIQKFWKGRGRTKICHWGHQLIRWRRQKHSLINILVHALHIITPSQGLCIHGVLLNSLASIQPSCRYRSALHAKQSHILPSLPVRYPFHTWARWGNSGKETYPRSHTAAGFEPGTSWPLVTDPSHYITTYVQHIKILKYGRGGVGWVEITQ